MRPIKIFIIIAIIILVLLLLNYILQRLYKRAWAKVIINEVDKEDESSY